MEKENMSLASLWSGIKKENKQKIKKNVNPESVEKIPSGKPIKIDIQKKVQTLKQPITFEKNLDQVKKKIDRAKSPGKPQVRESREEKLARCNFELPAKKLQLLKTQCSRINKSIREVLESYVDIFIKT